VALAKRCFKEGASIVIGSGPHVLQRVDVNNNHVAAYSLGNFLFDENKFNELFAKSGMLELKLSKEKIEAVNFFPVITSSGYLSVPKNDEIDESKKTF
jgi:poly-gamma-glutamate capsule biosynthesis protein CapA/YwtB (metallophosphatase superfamily)